MPEDMSEYMPEDMSDRMPEDMSEYMPEDMPDRMPDNMPEDMSDRVPEDMPDRMPEDLPDRMPEDMPDHMPEDMPDRMPNRMSEDMSDRMPEDLPVRKCINVMVGITRSKVIFSMSSPASSEGGNLVVQTWPLLGGPGPSGKRLAAREDNTTAFMYKHVQGNWILSRSHCKWLSHTFTSTDWLKPVEV